jgi:glycerol-3-phosphate O-acyltransferase
LPDGLPAVLGLRAYRGGLLRRLTPAAGNRLAAIVGWLEENLDTGTDIELVPVAVFWGRSPAKERSWLKLLLAEDWVASGRIRRFFSILVHGRQVLVKVSKPVSLRRLVEEGLDRDRTVRKTARLLRVHFRRQRAATIGPDLSHRRLLVDEVLASAPVRQAVQREVQLSHRSERRVERRARRIAHEITAHYSHAVVRILETVLGWLWNKLYEGIEVRHFDSLNEIAVGSEVVYVPCHRSHIDYLLLPYVIYERGLVPPHIAAGINLNLPLIGPVMRRGGAFFMRRSFRGDALYSAVFRSYLATIIVRGFPVKFFVEGTRSRTGRLLKPKFGLLSMTVESYLRDHRRPVVFVPVYFGYEKLVEGETFLSELQGRRKHRETFVGALRSLRALREHFGTVDVNIGEPIRLDAVLDRTRADWHEHNVEQFFRPAWIEAAVASLGRDIMIAINEAAVANPVSLMALTILSMPKHAIVEVELCKQLELYIRLLDAAPYSSRAAHTTLAPAQIIAHCERTRWLARRPHALGDILYMDERKAVLASYHRNNIVHMFALPSLVAATLCNRSEIGMTELTTTLKRLYPCFKAELFLRNEVSELGSEVDRVVAAMASLGIVERRIGLVSRPRNVQVTAAQFALIGGIVEPYVEHYYLAVIYLLEHGSGALDKTEIVARCVEAADQLAMLYSLNSPDLFEAGLFETLIDGFQQQGLVTEDADGRLNFAEPLEQIAEDLGCLLRPRVRQTLHNFAGAATTTPARAAGPGDASVGRPVEFG